MIVGSVLYYQTTLSQGYQGCLLLESQFPWTSSSNESRLSGRWKDEKDSSEVTIRNEGANSTTCFYGGGRNSPSPRAGDDGCDNTPPSFRHRNKSFLGFEGVFLVVTGQAPVGALTGH